MKPKAKTIWESPDSSRYLETYQANLETRYKEHKLAAKDEKNGPCKWEFVNGVKGRSKAIK